MVDLVQAYCIFLLIVRKAWLISNKMKMRILPEKKDIIHRQNYWITVFTYSIRSEALQQTARDLSVVARKLLPAKSQKRRRFSICLAATTIIPLWYIIVDHLIHRLSPGCCCVGSGCPEI
jgi:hypothetical protein